MFLVYAHVSCLKGTSLLYTHKRARTRTHTHTHTTLSLNYIGYESDGNDMKGTGGVKTFVH